MWREGSRGIGAWTTVGSELPSGKTEDLRSQCGGGQNPLAPWPFLTAWGPLQMPPLTHSTQFAAAASVTSSHPWPAVFIRSSVLPKAPSWVGLQIRSSSENASQPFACSGLSEYLMNEEVNECMTQSRRVGAVNSSDLPVPVGRAGAAGALEREPGPGMASQQPLLSPLCSPGPQGGQQTLSLPLRGTRWFFSRMTLGWVTAGTLSSPRPCLHTSGRQPSWVGDRLLHREPEPHPPWPPGGGEEPAGTVAQ